MTIGLHCATLFRMSIVKPILKSMLTQVMELLDDDQRMHFKKIHPPIDNMSKKSLCDAIQLVERTLTNDGIELSFLYPTIKNSEDVGGML